MRDATIVYVNLEARIFPNQCAGRCRMVKMDMREKNNGEISDVQSVVCELCAESVERRGWSGIDQSSVLLRADKC